MRLVGALSNQQTSDLLARLDQKRRGLLTQVVLSPPAAPPVRARQGSIQNAVVVVLGQIEHAISRKEVHALVEKHMGRAASKHTVGSCLSLGIRGSEPKFVRVAPDRYRIAVKPPATNKKGR